MTHPSNQGGLLVAIQASLALAVLLVLFAMPPARGTMLLVSLRGDNSAAIARWAVGTGALMIGTGPVAGSLVVYGTRGTLLPVALGHRALLVDAAAAGCGGVAVA